MSLLNNNIRVSEVDFESIKSNFREFLKSQGEFADFNFEASGMSVLMDLMAYNTYYNSVLANYMANETYIDSAVKRDSIVSHAKSLGYRPKSVKASKATISLKLKNAVGTPNQLVMKAGTPFETTIKEMVYQFVTLDDRIAPLYEGEYDFGSFDIYQGHYFINSFTAEGVVVEKFTLLNPNVDLSSIRVVVQKSVSDTTYDYYTFADNIIDVSSDSKVFFVQEGLNNMSEVYFGDGILGKQLAPGNIVYVTYITSAGQVTNGAKVFKMTGAIEGNTNVFIQTVAEASGGSNVEDTDSIKFNAMTYFGVQNRAVTADDCRGLIMQNFSNVKNMIVWGGEKEVPPKYGKIYVCIQPKNTEALTYTEKSLITDIVKRRGVANVTPEFIDPEYVDIEVSTDVFYDRFKNDKTTLELQNIVTDVISAYAEEHLARFDSIFRYSLLSRLIDTADYGILNNLLNIKVYKSFKPVLNTNNIAQLNFYNEITGISSSGFYVSGINDKLYMKSYENVIKLISYTKDNEIKVYDNLGSFDQNSGVVNIKPLNITNYDGDVIRVYASPLKNDVFSKYNTIVRMQLSNITVNIFDDKLRV